MTDTRDPRSFLPLTPLAFQVLLALADGERHGYGIIREVDARTDGLIRLRTGTLYTLLQRLLDEALIEFRATPGAPGTPGTPGTPGRSGTPPGTPPGTPDPRRKYYGLTDLGRGVLGAEATRLQALVGEARRKHVLGRESKV
jgi:DNA-binding PadR family transcriptional regulator